MSGADEDAEANFAGIFLGAIIVVVFSLSFRNLAVVNGGKTRLKQEGESGYSIVKGI